MNIQRQPAAFQVIPEVCDCVSDWESYFVEVLAVECLLHRHTVTLARTSVDVWSGANGVIAPMQSMRDCLENCVRTSKFSARFTVLVFEQLETDGAVQLRLFDLALVRLGAVGEPNAQRGLEVPHNLFGVDDSAMLGQASVHVRVDVLVSEAQDWFGSLILRRTSLCSQRRADMSHACGAKWHGAVQP